MFDLEDKITESLQSIQAFISELQDFTIKRVGKRKYRIDAWRMSRVINVEFESNEEDSEQIKVYITKEEDNSLGFLPIIIVIFGLITYGIVFTITGTLSVNEILTTLFLIVCSVVLGGILKFYDNVRQNDLKKLKERIIKAISVHSCFVIIEEYSNASLKDKKSYTKPTLSQTSIPHPKNALMKCPKCAHSNPPTNIFCDSCGYLLP